MGVNVKEVQLYPSHRLLFSITGKSHQQGENNPKVERGAIKADLV
jgi:hypothetical protein